MARAQSRTRVPSVIAEDERAFFGARVAMFARWVGLFTIAYAIVSLLLLGRIQEWFVFVLALAPSFVIGVLLIALGTLAKRPRLGRTPLEILDALVIVVVCVGFAVILLTGPAGEYRELVLALIATNMLLSRAAIVPSTGKRSAIVGTVAFASLVVTIFAFSHSWANAAFVLQWGVLAVLSSTRLSRHLFAMQRQVEAAQRFGQYTLEQKIGEGGMGEVFRARHALLRRPTALKLLPRTRAGARAIARFEREVQMTSRLTHPNTIQIYDYGRAVDGTFYYAMEYLDGITLEELVLGEGAQHPGRVARILADICASLAEAHDAGLVHRDIKAQNVMLCARGGAYDVVKVLDFGLVKTVAEDSDDAPGLAGTPAYMAPEVIAEPERFDAKSDLYAVGVLAYFLLTGAPLFTGRSAFELLGQHLHATPVPPSERAERAGSAVPARLEKIVLACLAKSPADRPASARILRTELLTLQDVLATWSDEDAASFWRTRGDASSEGELAVHPERTLLLSVNPA